MSRKIIGFLNSYSTGTSGGDVRFVEIMKCLPVTDKYVISSKLGRDFCINRGLNASFIKTSSEPIFKFKYIIFIYFMRIFRALTRYPFASNEDIMYVGSDILPDVLPAFLYKLFNKNLLWVQMIFHFIPVPRFRIGKVNLNNILSYLGQRMALMLIRKRADKIVVINSVVKNELIRYGIPERRIYIGGMGIDRDYFKRLMPYKGDKYEGVFIGRLHPSKGIFDLVNIWHEVYKRFPSSKLAIIGDGNLAVKNKLVRQIEDLSLGRNILLLGYLKDKDAYCVLKQAKVFLFPSYEEGWGLVIAEAIACGVSVIAYNLSIYKEVFSSGIIKVAIGDKTEFAKNVIELLGNDKKRKLLSSQALENLSLYRWDYVSQKEWGIINESER